MKEIFMNGDEIERVGSIKFFGYIFINLKWDDHFNFICNKTLKKTAVMNKLKVFVPDTVSLKLYNCLILPYLNCCLGV